MRKLIATLVVLALLLVGADIAGRLIAQQKISETLATRLDAATRPSVGIHGFSFLVQAVSGHYSHVTIQSDDLPLGSVDHAGMHADLYGVTLPLSDALSGSVDRLTANRADVRATIPVTALAQALDQPGLTLSAGPGGTVRMRTTVAVAGASFPVTADVAISVTDGALRLSARPVSAGNVSIPAPLSADLQRSLTRTIPLGSLPVPLDNATVTVSGGDLVVSASADNVDAGALLARG